MNDQPIVVYGTTWCPDCRRAKQFLGEQRIPYRWVDIERDAKALAYVETINNGMRIVPTIVFPDGSVLVEPTNAELAAKLGLQTQAQKRFYDLIIVGAGPAGLTAALYAAREGMEVLLIEKSAPGGQVATTQRLDNFPGFDEGISGEEFARRLTRQALRFGVELLQAQTVTQVRLNGAYREVQTEDGTVYGAHAVLVATGARYRRLGVPGEEELIGVNLHFCATCDGAFYRDKTVLVVGGGNSAFAEGLFLTRVARQVAILVRGTKPRASKLLQEKVARKPEITVLTGYTVQAFQVREGRLDGVLIQPTTGDGPQRTLHPDGVFLFVGMQPNSEFLPPEIARDEQGFVRTDATLQTSLPGVFAAGDVRAGATAQAASAAGEGAAAALMIRHYLQNLGVL